MNTTGASINRVENDVREEQEEIRRYQGHAGDIAERIWCFFHTVCTNIEFKIVGQTIKNNRHPDALEFVFWSWRLCE